MNDAGLMQLAKNLQVDRTHEIITYTLHYYAAPLPRRGRILRRTLSVCLSVRPVIVAIGNVFSSTASVTDVLLGMH